MPPRSPTHAFDPTPALEHNPDNFSPLNGEYNMDNHPVKEVHFSNPPASFVARHSIATTNVPLLASVSSASRIPKQAFISMPPGIDMNAYMENCRNLNEQLRSAHDTERKAWDIERSALLARIADLEFRLNKSRDPKRRLSNDSPAVSVQLFHSDFRNQRSSTNASGPRTGSESTLPSGPPIWRGPEATPPVTRVFSSDDSDVNHLPSISEDAEPFPSLSKEISPFTKEEPAPIDVSQVDNTLDGIPLRSTGPAITSSFVTKITSPQFGSPQHTPSPRLANRPPSNTLTSPPNNMALDVKYLLDPLDKKLKLYAGHTPMAIDGAMSVSDIATEVPTPREREDQPPEPAPTKRPPIRPSEGSDSYFSFSSENPAPAKKPEEPSGEAEPTFETAEDPALRGPLMLDPSAKSQAANSFLERVDAKLMEAAAQSRLRGETVTSEESDQSSVKANGDGQKREELKEKSSFEDGPQLRIKKSTNFGSAWGGDMPGRI